MVVVFIKTNVQSKIIWPAGMPDRGNWTLISDN